MRQDKSFHPGEAVAARNFADLLGRYFDRLVTIDPHLHRIKSLQEIYKIPTLTVTATALLADFIKKKIEKPLLIGPDEESKQWIERIASKHRVDCVVLKKKRYGDRRVRVLWDRSIPIHGRTAVLVDDIVSSGGTMIELVGQLRGAGFRKIVCIAVHPIFAGDSFERLKKAGATLIASCNTIGHESNAIDITPLLAAHLRQGFTAR
jgi:ribose-phosphate pyrophosphokinase